jgi:lysophospholipase L1-like esterase
MLEKWLKGGEWSMLLDLVSPRFFDVLPARELEREVRALGGNYVNRSRFHAARGRLDALLAQSGLPVRLESERAFDPRCPALERGQAVLRLYFLQLMSGPDALLDLRYERFSAEGHGLRWDPGPLYVCWDPAFLESVRRLYAAFYEDRPEAFRAALGELHLLPAEAALRRSFGGSEAQHAVVFRGAEFRQAFHEAFLQCQRSGCVLHRNFASLGLYLACLYQHLEKIGGAHDVRAAFFAARAGDPATGGTAISGGRNAAGGAATGGDPAAGGSASGGVDTNGGAMSGGAVTTGATAAGGAFGTGGRSTGGTATGVTAATGGTATGGVAAAGGTPSPPFSICTGKKAPVVSIYVVGDSTASIYQSDAYPLTGWGQVLGDYFSADCAVVKDKALPGRSAKSFCDEGNWTPIANSLAEGDFVIIQFGHNDGKTQDASRYTDPQTTFKQYLTTYVKDTRAKKALPILATPIHRNRWNAATLADTHGAYPPAMRELAVSLDVPLVDMTVLTKAYFERIGPEATTKLFMNLAAGESPNYPNGNEDNTHLQEQGARDVARLFTSDAYRQGLPVAAHLKAIPVAP